MSEYKWDGTKPPFDRTPKNNMEAMMMAYIGMSRVKRADGLLLVEPFSPCLFQQGSVPGPSVLMEYLRGHLKHEELKEVLENLEETKRRDRVTILTMPGLRT